MEGSEQRFPSIVSLYVCCSLKTLVAGAKQGRPHKASVKLISLTAYIMLRYVEIQKHLHDILLILTFNWHYVAQHSKYPASAVDSTYVGYDVL